MAVGGVVGHVTIKHMLECSAGGGIFSIFSIGSFCFVSKAVREQGGEKKPVWTYAEDTKRVFLYPSNDL